MKPLSRYVVKPLCWLMRQLAWPLIGLIVLYKRFVSPMLPPSCKYHPSCSQYAKESLMRHGLVVGSLLAAWRLVRCNPFSLGGYDPVPEHFIHTCSGSLLPSSALSSTPKENQ